MDFQLHSRDPSVDLDRVRYTIRTKDVIGSIWAHNSRVKPYNGRYPSNFELNRQEQVTYFIIDGYYTLAPQNKKNTIINYLNNTYHYEFEPTHRTFSFYLV